MEHYVTLFDSLFLPHGLALLRSMQRHAGRFTLWVLCMDDATHAVLERLALPEVRLLRLAEWETDALRRVRPTRSTGEYCWTLTPFAPRFVFDADPSVARVTYLDADMWFRRSPEPIFKEFEASGKAVLITDHGYAPELDQSETAGQYCVQFVVFERHAGEPVRQWWADRCLEWCFARLEDGRFGDQKYLEQWPVLFGSAVHVLERTELILGPWNAGRFPYTSCVAWHFHGARLVPSRRGRPVLALGDYIIPVPTLANIYKKYLSDLRACLQDLKGVGFSARLWPRPTLWARAKTLIYFLSLRISSLRATVD